MYDTCLVLELHHGFAVGGGDERDAVVLHLDSLRRGQHDRPVRGRQPRHTPHLPATCFLW